MQEEHIRSTTEEVLLASRVLVGIAARTIPGSEEVTLAQFRALVLLDTHGELKAGALAELLAVEPSTTTRLCDRLVAKGLIERGSKANRREVRIALSEAGRALVAEATAKRRAEIRKILNRVPPEARAQLGTGLRAFREAAGDVPAQLAWSLGWSR